MRPFISVNCPTYGRTSLLNELVECFERQDYDGAVEMLILNDRPDQTLRYHGKSNIIVHNVGARFDNFGHKRNELVAMSSGTHVAFWDDDDIYLPSHLTLLADALEGSLPGIRGSSAHHLWGTRVDGSFFVRNAGLLHAALLEKSAIEEVGGFPELAKLQDAGLVRRLIKARMFPAVYGGRAVYMPTGIYRTAGVDATHVCDFPTAELAHEGFICSEPQLREPTGVIDITPGWQLDYEQLTAAAWAEYLRR